MGAALIDEVVQVGDRRVRRMLGDLDRWGVITRVGSGPGRTPIIGPVKDFDQWAVSETKASDLLRSAAARVKDSPGQGGPDHPGPRRPDHPGQGGPATIENFRETLRERPSSATPTEPAAKKSPRKKPRTQAPEELTPEQKARVVKWCREHEPWVLTEPKRLGKIVAACLRHHQSKGNTSTDWCLNVYNWIGNEQPHKWGGPTGGKSDDLKSTTERLLTEARRRAEDPLALEALRVVPGDGSG